MFTPIDSDAARRRPGFVHIAPTAAALDERADAPLRIAGSPTPRPAFAPNPMIILLKHLRFHFDPGVVDRRAGLLARALGLTALASVVAFALGASFTYRASSVADPAAAARSSLSPAEPPAPTPSGIAASVDEALAALHGFLAADSPGARRAAIGATGPLPPCLAAPGAIDALAGATVARDQARFHLAGPVKFVLVPLTHADGLPHTAAILNRGDGWRVDWRSVITPERVGFREFLASPSPAPSPFRVLLSRAPDGRWSLAHPRSSSDLQPVDVAAHSRVESELAEALASHGGPPLAVDIFLATDPARRLHIVDWTKDKWSL